MASKSFGFRFDGQDARAEGHTDIAANGSVLLMLSAAGRAGISLRMSPKEARDMAFALRLAAEFAEMGDKT